MGQGTQLQFCSECGAEYEAIKLMLFNVVQDLSNGRCRECRAKARAETEKEEVAVRQIEISQKRMKWRSECGIPPKFMNKEFGTFDTKRPGNVQAAYDESLAYANGFPVEYRRYIKLNGIAYKSLVLFSTDVWGIGKTHLACSIGHKILNRWNGEEITNPIIFCSEPDLYRRIQATYHYTPEERRGCENEEDIILSMIYRPLLILDDVGKERRADPKFVQRILFSIIDGRYKNLRPIVVTTNMDGNSLRDYLGASKDEASYDRLWEMTGGEFFQIKGESYRRR